MRDNTPEQNIIRLSNLTKGMDEFEIVAYLSNLIEFDNMHPWQLEMIAKFIYKNNVNNDYNLKIRELNIEVKLKKELEQLKRI